jgi:hypothetical protein
MEKRSQDSPLLDVSMEEQLIYTLRYPHSIQAVLLAINLMITERYHQTWCSLPENPKLF